ncbi:rCG34065 [Rattus norvegicus]|uniref:RCG34065 n=1 Tax=Rattus norvegicus TaxID=10116 RepID=A6HDX9_RAT|nr:rCG34065 [Rattus norvegicus]
MHRDQLSQAPDAATSLQ